MFLNAIEILQSRIVKGSKFGLERTKELLRRLGNPQDRLKILHVAGTNGKGSTCEYLTCVLTDAGKKVGTFTSPEVYTYNEKFKICGKELSNEKLNAYLAEVLSVSQEIEDEPTSFEVETAAAYYIFYKEGCEYAVIECGMGGLYDSTNAVDKKEMAIITSISLEHTAFLGDTIESVCSHKAGIIKNCPSFVSRLQSKGVKEYFERLGCSFARPFERVEYASDYTSFTVGENKYKIAMKGEAQIYNACLCIAVCEALKIPYVAIKSGLERAKLLGRIERVDADRTYYLDGGHNPDGVLPLVDFINTNHINASLIYGCLSDKDVDGCAKNLSMAFNDAVVVAPDSYRAMEIEQIERAFKNYFKKVRVANDVRQAIDMAEGETVAICGTFTLLKESKKWIEKRL